MTLQAFLLKHVDKLNSKLVDKDTDLLYAYIQLLNLVLELTFSYFSLIFLALSLVSLHYFNKRIIGYNYYRYKHYYHINHCHCHYPHYHQYYHIYYYNPSLQSLGLPISLLCCSLSLFFLYTRSELTIS